MTSIIYLIPIALLLGLGALAVFVWTVRAGQYDDLEGDSGRFLSDEEDVPLTPETAKLRRRLLEPPSR